MVSPSTPKSRSLQDARTISSGTMSVPSRALIFSGLQRQDRGWGT